MKIFKDYLNEVAEINDDEKPNVVPTSWVAAVMYMIDSHAETIEKLEKRIKELEYFQVSVEEMPEYQHRV